MSLSLSLSLSPSGARHIECRQASQRRTRQRGKWRLQRPPENVDRIRTCGDEAEEPPLPHQNPRRSRQRQRRRRAKDEDPQREAAEEEKEEKDKKQGKEEEEEEKQKGEENEEEGRARITGWTCQRQNLVPASADIPRWSTRSSGRRS